MSFLRRFFSAKKAPAENGNSFSQLRADKILVTIEKLENRIFERFPESKLLLVCKELKRTAEESENVALSLTKPIWPLRIATIIAGILLLTISVATFQFLVAEVSSNFTNLSDFFQGSEAAINELIFLGLAFVFLVSVETRLKRRTALRSLHRLRSIAHVVDMHQLTKDPTTLFSKAVADHHNTASSPKRTFTKFELARYLDYCSELLALTSKTAALFAQTMDDPVVLDAVNDVESLTQGLSSKIWQKIMILDLALEKRKS